MARYAAVKDGLFSNSTDVWARVGYTSTFHASNVTGDITTTARESDTFTAPNTTNAAVGCLFYIGSNNQDSVYTITLQEYNGATWVDKSSNTFIVKAGPQWMFAHLTTPYVYTTTTANYYRYTLVRSSGSGTLFRMRRPTTGGTNTWGLIALDNRFASPTDGDEIIVVGKDSGQTTITVTFDGTRTIGNFGSTTKSPDPASSTTQAILIEAGGSVKADTAASCQLTIKGTVVIGAGSFELGSTSSAYPSGQTAKVIFNQNGVSGNYGYFLQGNTTFNATLLTRGQPPTGYNADIISGVGTAANPLITSGDIGVVGDEICLPAEAAYGQTEYKFIKTKNSATSYVLSDTSGGAESGIAYAHIKAANMTRNVSIESTDINFGWYAHLNNTVQNRSVAYFRDTTFKHIGGTSSIGSGQIALGYSSGQQYVIVEYIKGCVFTELSRQAIYMGARTRATNDITDNLFCRTRSVGSTPLDWPGSNQVVERMIICDNPSVGFDFGGYNNSFTDLMVVGNNTGGGAGGSGIRINYANGSNTFENLDIQSNRVTGILVNQPTSEFACNNATIGNRYTNTIDLTYASDILVNQIFRSSLFGSATLASGYLTLFAGSRIGFHRYQNTDRRHFSLTPNGDFYSTGSSLSDTTADTTFDATSLAFKYIPNSASIPLSYNFSMPQRAGNTIIFNGKMYKDGSFNGTFTANLYLDGSSTPDATYTLSGSASTWIPFVISADYTSGTVDRNARIEVKATGTAGSVYLDTLFNASKTSNPIGSMDLWQDGVPNEYLVSTVASASEVAGAVWADTTTYDAGSKGAQQKDASKAKLLL